MRGLTVVTALIFASAVAFSVSASAQQAKEHSMTGCMARNTETEKTDKNGNVNLVVTYKLTDVEGTGPKTVEIAEGPMSLALYLNHKVQITGTAVPGKDKNMHYMRVTLIKTLANTCP